MMRELKRRKDSRLCSLSKRCPGREKCQLDVRCQIRGDTYLASGFHSVEGVHLLGTNNYTVGDVSTLQGG